MNLPYELFLELSRHHVHQLLLEFFFWSVLTAALPIFTAILLPLRDGELDASVVLRPRDRLQFVSQHLASLRRPVPDEGSEDAPHIETAVRYRRTEQRLAGASSAQSKERP